MKPRPDENLVADLDMAVSLVGLVNNGKINTNLFQRMGFLFLFLLETVASYRSTAAEGV